MLQVFLKSKISHRVINGHPWIFANEVQDIKEEITPGEIAEVYTHDKKFVGKGYINPQSQIIIRLLTRNKAEEINAAFFRNRLAHRFFHKYL